MEVKGLTLAKQTRINRNVFEYTYKINIANSGSPLAGVVASIASSSAKMQIVDATVNLGDLAGYAQGLSNDTFIIRLDRSVAFNASALTWQVNGEQTQDVCKSTPSITTPTPTIHQTLPASAPTGSAILINGTGFTTCSHVFLGGKEIFLPKIISEHQLQIFVPFDLDTQNQLIPLAADSYSIKVDGSSPYDFTVTDLPENPNPPGQLLSELIDSTFQLLSESLPEFQAILPQLLDENTDDPATQKLLQNLNALVSEINAKGSSDLISQLNAIDQRSLNTLERAILNNTPPDSGSTSAPAMSKAITTAKSIASATSYNCSRASGDEWLKCRQVFADTSQYLNNITKALGYCSKLTAITGGATALACAKIGLLVGLVSTAAETSVAYKLGSVRKLEFQVSNVPKEDIVSDGTSLNLRVNNADNNYDHPTFNAKIALGAKLGISNQVNIALILKTFMDVVLHAVDVDLGQAGEWLRDYALDWKNDQINKPTDYVLVTPAVLKHILTDGFYESIFPPLLTPSSLKPPCNIHDSDGYFAMQTSPKGSGALDWVFAVPDQGGLTFINKPIGDCEIKIADQFRMASEDDISSKINVFVKRYAKLAVSVTGDGYVTYGLPTYSRRDKCDSGTSPCTEYFYVPIGTPITLTAYNHDGSNATSSTWNGSGMSTESCKGATDTCVVNLDVKNNPSPNVVVSFSSDGIYGIRLTLGKYKQGGRQLECSRSPEGIYGECGPLFSSEEEYDGNGASINLLFHACGGRTWSVTHICRINGKFKAISLTDTSFAPYGEGGLSGTRHCSAKLKFDGNAFSYEMTDNDNYKATQSYLEATVAAMVIHKTDFSLSSSTISQTQEMFNDVISNYINDGITGQLHERSISFFTGELQNVELYYVEPADLKNCP